VSNKLPQHFAKHVKAATTPFIPAVTHNVSLILLQQQQQQQQQQ
jgi:hypothetical protein